MTVFCWPKEQLAADGRRLRDGVMAELSAAIYSSHRCVYAGIVAVTIFLAGCIFRRHPEEPRRSLMIDTPQITQTAGLLTAFVHLTVPREDVRKVMGPGLDEVKAAIAAQGIATTGPWFTHHLRMEPGIFDFEICVPVTAPIEPVGRVEAGQWPVTTVARTVFHGDYE